MSIVNVEIYLHDEGDELVSAIEGDLGIELSKDIQREFRHPIYEVAVGIVADTDSGQYDVQYFDLGGIRYVKEVGN